MAKKNKLHRGVFTRKRKSGMSYGIDYIHPQTGQRVRRILKRVKSEAEALKYRAIELADEIIKIIARKWAGILHRFQHHSPGE